VFGAGLSGGGSGSGSGRASDAPATAAPDARSPTEAEVRRLCRLATAAAGVHDGHLAVEFVSAERIAELNARYRMRATATDVLAFPIDDAMAPRGQRAGADDAAPAGTHELGDVMICPEQASDIREAIVHGVLHLVGLDHETDDGEMLALQRRLLAQVDA